jgi:hypothetical protein
VAIPRRSGSIRIPSGFFHLRSRYSTLLFCGFITIEIQDSCHWCHVRPFGTVERLLWLLLTSEHPSSRFAARIADGRCSDLPGYHTHTLSHLCPSHLLLCFPCKYWASNLYAFSPSIAASCASCSSGQCFAYSFLQIRPHERHPCCSANVSPYRAHRRLSLPRVCALPGAHKKGRQSGRPFHFNKFYQNTVGSIFPTPAFAWHQAAT